MRCEGLLPKNGRPSAVGGLGLGLLMAAVGAASCGGDSTPAATPAQLQNGMTTFRSETFGDEQFWTGVLQMNTVIETGVSPATALSVGLKVDADALPA